MNKALTLAIIAATATIHQQSLAAENTRPALEEVVVTATKRESSLQDVSIAVTALSADMLKNAQITQTADLVALVPSLNMQTGSSVSDSSFNIRGIGTQVFGIGVEPSVATMIDGVVLGRAGQAFMQLNDVERVEVLRGPQGTLFGKNSSGGVVHIITQNPSNEQEAKFSATAIEKGEYQLGGTVSGPITETLGYRITAFGSDDDGYVKNLYNGDELNGGTDWSTRGKLRWLPTDSLELEYTGDYSRLDCDCNAQTIRQTTDPESIEPLIASSTNDQVNTNSPTNDKVKSYGHALTANWQWNDYTITSISAYRDWEEDFRSDTDAAPISVFGLESGKSTGQDQYSQELRLTSPGEDRLSYVAGLYYFNQTVDREEYREILSATTDATFSTENTNYAAYGEANYQLTDTVRLVAGARYTHDELSYDFKRVGGGTGLPPPVDSTGGNTKDDDTTVKIASQWDFDDDAMAYVSYSQGYKGQAYNALFSATEESLDKSVDPEKSDAYELGLKSTLFDRRLELNAALFYTEFKDFQASSLVDDSSVDSEQPSIAFVVQNVGEVSTKGLEVDFRALVTEKMSLYGGFAYIDATIDDFPGGTCSFGQEERGECPLGYQDLSNQDLPQSPDWKMNLTVDYAIDLPSQGFDLIARAAYRAQDDVQFDISQDSNTIQDAYGVLDLAMTLTDKQDRYSATVFVKNALDEHYVTGIYSLPAVLLPGGYMQFLPKTYERTFGITVSYHYF
jgi:iron complex outermembrane receptor protein